MILGLDIGTTSVSGVLFDLSKKSVAGTESRQYAADVDGLPTGCHEQCPQTILDVSLDVIRSLAGRAKGPVEHIALTGQMHGIMAVDENFTPVTNLITWRDQRTADYPQSLLNHVHAPETGCFLHPGYGGITLHDLLKTGKLPRNTHKVLSIAGFIAAGLTGICSIDETFAASWGIWDVRKAAWHEALLDELDIPVVLLPSYIPSCSEQGTITDAKALGVASGAIVYSPVGDNQAGVAGVLEPHGSEAVVNLGTSGQLSVPLADYAFSPQLETRPCPGGRFIQIYAALCGGWSYVYLAGFFQQVIEQLGGKQMSVSDVLSGMQNFCRSTDAVGISVDTRFAGQRNGTQRTGSISEIDTNNLTPKNLTRGFINGMVGELASAAKLVDLSTIDRLVAVGNAVRKNPVLLTAIQEQFGLPCRMVEMPEEAATGAVKSVADLNVLHPSDDFE